MIAGGLPAFGARRPPLDAHSLATTILSATRFRVRTGAQPRKTLWDMFWGWLGDRWNDLLDAFGRHVHLGKSFSFLAGDAIIVLAVAAVIFAAVRLLSNYVWEPSDSGRGDRGYAQRPSAHVLFAQSNAAADRGEFAVAIALLFQAALAALDVRGVVHDDPSRTVNECRREVRRTAPRCIEPFDALARAFTAVLYAEVPAGEAQWTSARAAYAALVRGPDNAA